MPRNKTIKDVHACIDNALSMLGDADGIKKDIGAIKVFIHQTMCELIIARDMCEKIENERGNNAEI